MGDVEPSLAPSMDIQIASNFERFLYYTTGEDAAKTRETMSEIKERKAFSCEDPKVLRSMSSSRMSDTEIRETISSVYERFGYVVDPHTACGFKDLESLEHCVILSTAHPAKFPDIVEEALGQTSTHPELDALKTRDIIKFPLSPEANSIKEFIASKQ